MIESGDELNRSKGLEGYPTNTREVLIGALRTVISTGGLPQDVIVLISRDVRRNTEKELAKYEGKSFIVVEPEGQVASMSDRERQALMIKCFLGGALVYAQINSKMSFWEVAREITPKHGKDNTSTPPDAAQVQIDAILHKNKRVDKLSNILLKLSGKQRL